MPRKGGVPANLKNFPKGTSGNPAGKPKGTKHLSTVLKEFLESNVTTTDEDGKRSKMPFKEAIIQSLLRKAAKGDVRAIQEIFDRVEGKPDQKVQAITDITVNVKRK